ncbi:MAG: 4-(cytidine 5'-diphospho)-2-C-methyl-D-erythritol kinase [Hyphomicrobiales bacterium]
MVDQVTEFAPAKINLSLRVTGRRHDGYHLLDSIVGFAGVGDRLVLTPADEFSLTITGPMAEGLEAGSGNLVMRAAQALRQTYPERFAGAAIVLEKNLPVASGIGGGSADAAAALRGMISLYEADEIPEREILKLALSIGADVPVCVRSTSARMSGIGDLIQKITGIPTSPMVLINPGIEVSTQEVFQRLDGWFPASASAQAVPEFKRPHELCLWLSTLGNDLEQPAVSMAPEIRTVLDALDGAKGAMLARMSGSGATCFGLFASAEEARAAGDEIGRAHENWWVAATEIMSDGDGN